jgi:molecular chaperone DnaK
LLLVGGSTRMPMVGRMLEELTGRPLDRSVSPDEAVAHGAALFADLHLRRQSPRGARFSATNVNSHSLGIVGVDPRTGRKRNQILIPKNTALPHIRAEVFKTHKANQPNVAIRVVEGESERPEACIPIGVCTVALPPDVPAGWPVQVSYAYGSNGRLEVTAQVKGQAEGVTAAFQRENSMGDRDIEMWARYFADQMRAG